MSGLQRLSWTLYTVENNLKNMFMPNMRRIPMISQPFWLRLLRTLLALFLTLLLIAALSACGSSSSALDGPAEVVKIARNNCISCHGTELQGKMGPDTNLQHVGKRLSKEQIAGQIRNGGDSMPAFESRLSDDEIEGLAAWLSGKK